jgi:membrane protease YdiL (CAAX protease family)
MTPKVKFALFLLGVGLGLEFILRPLIFPDPWLVSGNHWYFNQPLRLLIEIAFVGLAAGSLLKLTPHKKLLSLKLNADQKAILLYGSLISLAIFGLLEFGDIRATVSNYSLGFVGLWALTGFFTGVGQELTFRGLVYTGLLDLLETRWGFSPQKAVWASIGLSTVLFTIGPIHSQRLWVYFTENLYAETLFLSVSYLVFGGLFGYLRYKSDHVLVPAIIHGFGNALTWLAIFS